MVVESFLMTGEKISDENRGYYIYFNGILCLSLLKE